MSQLPILISLFLIVLAGFLAYQVKVFSQETAKYFNKFIFYFAAPAIIFSSLTGLDKTRLSAYPSFFLINTAALCLLFLTIFLLLRLTKLSRKERGTILYTAGGANVIIFGYPILLSLFPREHFGLGVIYSIAAITIGDLTAMFLLGIERHDKSFNFKKTLIEFAKNPVVISSFLGFIALLVNISLPKFISSSLDILGKPTTALGLFSLGIYFGHNINFNKIKLSIIPVLVRLIIFPLSVYWLTSGLFRLDQAAVQTSVVMAAMPSAIFSIVVADVYDLDKTLTSNTVILSSILFLFTSPFWIWLVTK